MGIVGSPHRGGNTETLVDEALMGTEEAGAMTQKVVLSEVEVVPCKTCNVPTYLVSRSYIGA